MNILFLVIPDLIGNPDSFLINKEGLDSRWSLPPAGTGMTMIENEIPPPTIRPSALCRP